MEYVPFQYERARQELALALMLAGVVLTKDSNSPLVVKRGSERGFRLKHHETEPDAPLMPILFNLRTPDNPKSGPLTRELIEKIVHCMQYVVSQKRIIYDGVVGVPNVGNQLAAEFERITGKPLVVLEKWQHGEKRHIMPPRDRIREHLKKFLLIGGWVEKAKSKEEAINIMRQDEDKAVTDIVVLIDYELGGREELAFLNCTLHPVFTASELLDIYVRTGLMKPAIRDEFRELLLAA